MVGYGFIGKVHAQAHKVIPLFYEPVPLRTRLVAVCTSRQETAEKARDQAGFDVALTDPEALFALPDIDLVHCCTPNAAHYSFLKAALLAGKHVYCDKPLALTVAEAQELATLAKQVGTVCRMTFNYRFLPESPITSTWPRTAHCSARLSNGSPAS